MSASYFIRGLVVLSSLCIIHVAQAATSATITFSSNVVGLTPDRIGYNLGHYFPGSNTSTWWAYSGANAARMWSNASVVEPSTSDDLSPWGDGVIDLASFNARRAALRNDPLSTAYVNWSYFTDRYETQRLTGNNMYLADTLRSLTEMSIRFVIALHRSETAYPWRDPATALGWADRWEHWQHNYAQAFYLARYYGIERFQMFNEPDHSSHPTLTQEIYLQRLQFASDAIQCAVQDVNRLFGKHLVARVQAPVTAGGYAKFIAVAGGDPRNDVTGWGELVIRNRHVDYAGQYVPGFNLLHTYAYQAYNMTGPGFASDLASIKGGIDAESGGEDIKVALTEFNVHTAATFDTMTETLDSPMLFTRMGSILSNLANTQADELYIFKFSQTDNSGDGTVKKNGVHYVANNYEPYNIGGITKGGEVVRLFMKGFAGGRSLLALPQVSGNGTNYIHVAACRDEAGTTYILCTNLNESTEVNVSMNLSALGFPAGVVACVEEVSSRLHGEVVDLITVPLSGTIQVRQRPASVLLLTILPAPPTSDVTLIATDDAMVKAGSNADSNFGQSVNLWAKSNLNNANARNASLLKFNLGTINPAAVRRAVLKVVGSNPGGSGVVIAHVYGVADDGWEEETVTWSGVTNLGTAMGRDGTGVIDEIADNYIVGAGQTAQIVGHLSGDGAPAELKLDVTRFVRESTDQAVSFLIAREVRFDGDVDDVNYLRLASKEDTTVSPPRLMLEVAAETGPTADFDGDLDVDLEDFAYLQSCYTELAQLVDSSCRDADLTGDSVVDQFDATVLLECLSGQGNPADPNCAE